MDVYEVARTAVDEHRASQHADELADVLALIASHNPKVIVEIGCDRGGTLYAWRQLCDRVYGITLADNSHETGGGGGPLEQHGANVLIGDSHDRDSFDWLAGQLDGDWIDVLIIDGDHSVAGVVADLFSYTRLLAAGGLLLIHDIAVTSDPRAEVWRVWPGLVRIFPVREIRSTEWPPYGWGVIEWT